MPWIWRNKVAEMGVERIVYTDIARDGMMTGVNLEATREIAEASGLKVTAVRRRRVAQ